MTSVPRADGVALVRELVRVDSRNPSLVPDAPGEGQLARRLSDVLDSWGLDVRLQETAPGSGRPNVIAVLPGSGGGRSLMFNGHMDVVGVEGMVHAPFDAFVKNGRIYGRGASDMKGGVAAMCAAAARLRGELKGDLIVTAVTDEEWKSAGTSAVLASGLRADAAIVTEPTRLAIMPAHRGFAWIEVRVHGRAAHGSRWDIGVDAIRHAGLLLAELDRMDSDDLPRRSHALLGRPSLHASLIEGGIELSTYPDRCVLRLERRIIPGEAVEDVVREIDQACVCVREARPEFRADVELLFSQPPSDVPTDAPIVHALSEAVRGNGLSPSIAGMSAWTDAALLNAAGIPAICFGPGDMGLAHAAEEYIEADEIERAAEVLVSLAQAWCN
ncbi:MAG TPA: ArgE/DapE family deacylase [Gemmatimonadaceae bacterium]|nr:ArgE/DapE family deacylase [Gemmatimonadaceae bacterium]